MSDEISIFDIKQLYDAAYAEKAKARVSVGQFRNLMAKAERLERRYRHQLEVQAIARLGRAA